LLTKIVIKTLCVIAAPFVVMGCVQPLDPGPKASDGSNPMQDFTDMYGNGTYTHSKRHTFSEVGKDFDPFVTRDGKKIIYASTRISAKSDIFMKNASSKIVEQITSTPYADEKQPQLSPNGKSIIYASDKSGKWGIYEISTLTRGKSETEVVSNGRVNEQPAYSPDGSMIAYATWIPGEANWYIATMDRKTQSESIYGPGVFPKFSPDGSKLLFQRPRSRAPQWYSIWILDLKTEFVSEIISNNNWAAVTPNWSPDGKKIIFAAINKSVHKIGENAGDEIYTINADGTHLVRLTEDRYEDWNPVWSKTGRIFFVSKRNGFQNIWSIKPKAMDSFHPDTIETQVDDVSRLEGL
jgi:Tol biopolymer transport system component